MSATETTHSLPTGKRRSPVPTILAVLDVLAIGILIGLIIGNHLLRVQIATYGEVNPRAASVVIELMDDFAPPLAVAILAVPLLSILTVASWLIAGIHRPHLRLIATGLLVVLILGGALWFGLGRRSPATPSVPLRTPTPAATAP